MEFKDDISHVLVIDDDEFLLLAIKKTLESEGYKITISDNVHDAYFKLNIMKPDLILLDIIMPDINGLEFMALLKSQYEMFDTPVVLMSYLDRKELLKMGHDITTSNYLPKPLNLKTLSAKLQHLHLSVK
jgi:DNA-binding response OmpR family regulator